VEPNTYPHSDHDRAKLLHRIWPSVQCANVICPVDARIKKGLITFTCPNKPMPRATKGFVQRKQTFELNQTATDKLNQQSNLQQNP